MAMIVRDYIENYQTGAATELSHFAQQSNVAGAIAFAARAVGPDGKRLSHQRRIPGRVLDRVRRVLTSAERDLARSKSFGELHDRIEALIRPIHGVGELMVYDTALRIGASLGLEPELVYLHAGTRRGAQALGVQSNRAAIPPTDLPRAFQRLQPREIEDVLCIYQAQLNVLVGD